MLSSVVHPSVAAAAAQAALRKTIELSGSDANHTVLGAGSSSDGDLKCDKTGDAELRREGGTRASIVVAKGGDNVDSATKTCIDSGASKVKMEDESSEHQSTNSARDLLVSEEALQVAAATALAAGAASASDLAEVERRNIDALMRSLVDLQLRRIELKLSKLRAVEDAVARSKEQMVSLKM